MIIYIIYFGGWGVGGLVGRQEKEEGKSKLKYFSGVFPPTVSFA